MLIHAVDAGDEAEWRAFVAAHRFGDLVAGGRERAVPVVVPTQFLLDDTTVLIHLARPNPVWAAIEENPRVMLAVSGDWAFIPSDWKKVIDPRDHGARLRAIRGSRIVVDDVRAKFKYGGNVDVEHRRAVARHLERRAEPGDGAARGHLARRSGV